MKKSFWLSILAILLLPVFAFAYSEAYPLIQTDKDIYNYGEEIKVHFSNAPGYPRDWVCIVPEGYPDTSAGDYQYIPQGATQGVMVFRPPQPGNYEARAYYGYSPFQYNVSARWRFTVMGDDYGYIDGGYYDAPVIYGEPCYYQPPIVVTFGFDYFTYELSGRYVDIVFWRGGHPYHRKPWHHGGRRVTSDYIHSGQWHNNISPDDLSRHRDKLREHNNISHPDSFYGIKPGQRPQVTGVKPQPDNRQIPRVSQPRQWDRKSTQQTPKNQVWGQQPSGRKSPQQIPNSRVTGQPSSQTERKTGLKREKSQDKEKQSGESSGQTEHKSSWSRESSSQSDNHSQSGWGGGSGGSSSGQSQGSSRDNHNGGNDKKGRW